MVKTTGLIHTKIALKNPKIEALNSLEATALVDTDVLHLCIPEHVALQLGYDLNTSMVREVTTADSKKHVVPYVGPIQITFQNRSCFTGALVLGDEVLLGAVPMEDMDLILSPAEIVCFNNGHDSMTGGWTGSLDKLETSLIS